MESVKARKLVLASGSEYYGEGFGSDRDSVCEVVFNTSMAGYHEIVSDPSYTDQAVCMTYPIIGNYGITDEDYETKTPTIGALIVRDYNDNPSNFRYTKTLGELMQEYNIPGLAGVDTRRLTREIRSAGSQKGLICSADMPIEAAMELLAETELRQAMVFAHVEPQVHRRGRRLRHQAGHGQGAQCPRLQRHGCALQHHGRGDRLHEAGRHTAVKRPRRS